MTKFDSLNEAEHVKLYQLAIKRYNKTHNLEILREYQIHFWFADLLHCQRLELLQGVKIARLKLNQLGVT